MQIKPASPVLEVCRLLAREKRDLTSRVHELSLKVLDKNSAPHENQKNS